MFKSEHFKTVPNVQICTYGERKYNINKCNG